MDRPASEGGSDDNASMTGPRWSLRALHLGALSAFAFAQPLFQVLGDGPAFFVAHRMDRLEIIGFAALIVLVPPSVLLAVIAGIGRISKEAGDLAMSASVGGLLALTVVPGADRAFELDWLSYAVLLVLIATAAGTVYHRSRSARTYATFLAPAPIAFVVVFLFFSPVRTMVVADDPEAITSRGTADHNVIMVVFDEFPLGALLTPDGAIDRDRFPGFAALADLSTWYPSATTASPKTIHAIPSLLTGTYPQEEIETEIAPVAAEHPRNLFTLLGRSHRLRVTEWVTKLCPEALCGGDSPLSETTTTPSSVASDVGILLQHLLLPKSYVEANLVPLGDRWANFGLTEDDLASKIVPGVRVDADGVPRSVDEDGDWKRGQFRTLLDSLHEQSEPTLWFAHERLPHRPLELLPDGRRYQRHLRFVWHGNQDRFGGLSYRQQFLLQVKYVDAMILELVRSLEERDLLDDTMVVVTSDHGLNLNTKGHPRARNTDDPAIVSHVAYVPLFIHYPGQEEGDVDRRGAQLVDVIPTIADVLDVAMPTDWEFDGRSLIAPPGSERDLFWHPLGALDPGRLDLDPLGLARQSQGLFGSGSTAHDLYAMGPWRHLIGQEVRGGVQEQAMWQPVAATIFDDVSADAEVVPALLEGVVEGVPSGTWLLAALNGRVAGTGPVFEASDDVGRRRFELMLDPEFLVDGRNTVEVYVVEDDQGPVLGRLEGP